MKNEHELRGDHAAIWINWRGERLACLVDLEDLDRADEWDGTWFGGARTQPDGMMVRSWRRDPVTGERRILVLHRWLLGLEDEASDKVVRHRDGDPLNCRRTNLLVLDQADLQGIYRAPKATSSSAGRRGVTWDKHAGKWKAQLMMRGKAIHLGLFEDPDEAAARVTAYRQQHGQVP